MRISDWSSDVCSSDLALREAAPTRGQRQFESIADADLVRETRIKRQVARVRAGDGVEDQAGKDDPDPAGRDQPQFGPDQPERQRHRGAREQQINSPAGGIDHRERSSLSRSDGEVAARSADGRSEEHTSELQSLMRNSYAVFCL